MRSGGGPAVVPADYPPRSEVAPRAGLLLREQPADVLECLELECVAARVEEEHRRLLADLTLEAHVRLDDEAHARGLQLDGEPLPLTHRQDRTEVAHGDVVSVD